MTLRVLSRLMSYPTPELQSAVPEMGDVLRRETLLPAEHAAAVQAFARELAQRPLTAVQEEYVALFDRGRALSLHLFEHVHGESRDRGQAMVDLLELYRSGGLELDARELPDYLPLMLEYLSTRPRSEAAELLGDAMPVIVLLAARLRQRGSGYAVMLEALQAAFGVPENADALREAAAGEGPDQTIEKMDEIWEEEQVTFLGNQDPSGGCGNRLAAHATRPAGSRGVVRTIHE
ncbi:MAG: nitrate reductase molybdenum cofactor assembly chaperone [Gammaproteobacteria bacterium HGW-Gammaproteobacteria-8]|nr:MAG: nitrate reductase molybdenum cofactor assembly chaperone [Gammaproteobacteria bacterium HGW-Gammaproteobacteria-8]